MTPAPDPKVAELVERFFIDHGMIHDRETGRHVTTAPDDETWNGGTISHALALLNELAATALQRLGLGREGQRPAIEPHEVQTPTYFKDADMLEYVSADVPTVARRIDDSLTVLVDIGDRNRVVGFQLYGPMRALLSPDIAERARQVVALLRPRVEK